MYLNPVVSLSVSSFELVLVLSISTILCSVPVVPILSHVLTSRSHNYLNYDRYLKEQDRQTKVQFLRANLSFMQTM